MNPRAEHHSGFDDLSDWYATGVGRAFEAATDPILARLVEARPGERWLDAGAGAGRLAALLAARGAEVVATDHDAGLLDLAAARAPEVTTVVASLENLPFGDASFAGATCVTVLEFVTDRAAALAELARVLADDAPLVVGAMHRSSLWGLGHRLQGRYARSSYGRGAFARTEEIDRMLAEAGLAPEGDWQRAVWWPPLGGPVGPLRSAIDAAGSRLAPGSAAFVARRARRGPRAARA
ncbi:MAG: class I SAM-dependent methyltransferase [Actinomycetota bacterium]|nr:class I SAM-dependent methyltransferase [Actinomycetota bacterium]